MIITMTKDPEEDLDYTWDFTDVLVDEETISSYSFERLPTGVALHDVTSSNTAVTAWVYPGGVVGTNCLVTCRVVTSASPPRKYDRSIKFVFETK